MIKENISKNKWIEAKELEDGFGIKVLLVNDYTNNFVPSLGGTIRSSGKDCVLLTFTNNARQMRTRIKCGKTKLPVSDFDFSKSFSVSLENRNTIVVSSIPCEQNCAAIRVYMQKKSYLYPLAEFSVDVYSNTGSIDRIILGEEIPCRNQEILYGYDIINI